MTGKKEIIIFAAVFVLLAAITVFTVLGRETGNKVSVTEHGQTRIYPLGTDAVIELPKNTVIIADGEVYVDHADCPRQICVNTGKISKVGEQIACIPNEVLVEIIK